MSTVFTPTARTFTQLLAATSYATGAAPQTTITLDLTTKFGADLLLRIGRNAATALTRAARFSIRRTNNGSASIRHPANAYDFLSSTAAVNATTLNGAVSAAATTALLTSGTGFAADQTCLAQSSGLRAEFFSITDLTTATITIDDSGGFLIAHNSGDVVTNGADCGTIWLPGGDIWKITPINNSGQTLVFAADAEIYASDTGT